MLSLTAVKREKRGKKVKELRQKSLLPAVLYGEGIEEGIPLEVKEKEFEEVFQKAGESSLIRLKIEGKEFEVLIHQIAKNPLTDKISHVEFFKPSVSKEVVAEVALVFEGEAPAVKGGGNLLKETQSVQVKGLARHLPHEIKVDLGKLKTFEDKIFVKDLVVPKGITILKDKDDIIALVVPPAKEEKELAGEEAVKEGEKAAETKTSDGKEKK